MYGSKEIAVPMTELSQNVYVFDASESGGTLTVRLRQFRHEVKATKRHKWKGQQKWGNGMNSRYSTCSRPSVGPELYAEAVGYFRSCVVAETEGV